MIEIPFGLRSAIESGKCVLFLGAGMGHHLLNEKGVRAPSGWELAKEIANHFKIDCGDKYVLTKVAKLAEIRVGRKELEEFVKERLSNLEPDRCFQWIFSQNWRAIYTTNYDCGIQRAYVVCPKPTQKVVTIAATSDIPSFDRNFDLPVIHLHGTLFEKSKPEIVITDDDYAKFRERRRMLFELLKVDFATSTILYIGYSNEDPNWNMVLNEIMTELSPSKMPPSFRISPKTDPIDKEILQSKNIESIDFSFMEFVDTAQLVISDVKHM